jgi:dTDP-4-amino-4,6-dideoxygalactose transaminase
MVDKYSWVDLGSSYLPSELNAAYLWAQLEHAETINIDRLRSWYRYYERLKTLEKAGDLELPQIPPECRHNAHMFYIKVKDYDTRTRLIDYLKKRGVHAVFHYVPLHSSPAGKRFGRFHGTDRFTRRESERLLRLPMYYGLKESDIEKIYLTINDFFNTKYNG